MKIRVYYEDTDCMGIVYHSNYLKYCERARSELFFAKNGKKFLEANAFVVREINAIYKAAAKFGDFLEIKSEVESISSHCLSLKQEIYKDEKIIFSAVFKLAHLKDGKLAKIDDELSEFLKKLGVKNAK